MKAELEDECGPSKRVKSRGVGGEEVNDPGLTLRYGHVMAGVIPSQNGL